ncbi:histidine phosphatase family protein [Citreimonas salinaria]|uniref:Alpha-ribazole phosphatase n=1 Tax=Citreimonas salinaria TaxID=321339 RepID=A0A1H3GA54_9RHOB|nr:histidine phosphatase family protein [Citreimonas salinaria]SDY00212.1 alpha-ribazole phosphatase [Citreimonas salinaria]
MALTLLRHTKPDVARGVCYGMTELALAATFAEEAAAIVRDLPRPARILTSPLSRCRLLAEHLGALFDLPAQVDPRWREMDFGGWEGRAWDRIPRAGLDAWAEDFRNYSGHGGESVAQLEARIREALAASPEGALIVTHAGCIKAACAIRDTRDGWDTKPAFGEAIRLPDAPAA